MPCASRGRRWCFTLNNPFDSEGNRLVLEWPGDVVYSVYQLEKGKEGTQHYQGYVCMSTAASLTAMRNMVPKAHWEVCKGTHDQNKAYCTKAETRQDGPWEAGKEPEQGARNDLVAIKRKLDEDVPMDQIADEHFGSFLRYEKGFYAYKLLRAPERAWKTEVEVHWGVTSAGKSHYAKQLQGAFWKEHGQWWEGYDGHTDVVIDEFYGWLTPSFLLRLFDDTPMRVEVKGGSRAFVARRIIVTSNVPWENWWRPEVQFSRDAMRRRITKIVYYDKPYVAPTPMLDPSEVPKEEPTRNFSVFNCQTENQE